MDSAKGSQGWNRSKRHSSQGYSLIDLIGVERLKRIVPRLQQTALVIAEEFKTFDEVVKIMDLMFKTSFFAGRFGANVDMVEAAEIYYGSLTLECDSFGAAIASACPEAVQTKLNAEFLRETIRFLNIRKFRILCIVTGKPAPASDDAALAIMHRLRCLMLSLSDEERALSKEWLQSHILLEGRNSHGEM